MCPQTSFTHSLSPKVPSLLSGVFPGTYCVAPNESHPELMLLVRPLPERAFFRTLGTHQKEQGQPEENLSFLPQSSVLPETGCFPLHFSKDRKAINQLFLCYV